MWPKAILFDLDDTLFDHQHASAIALDVMHAAHAPTVDRDAFAAAHAELLEYFHQRFICGEFTLDGAREARMNALFSRFGINANRETSNAAAALYRHQHQTNRQLVQGARELLEELRGKTRLGVVTNNSTAEQIEKLRALDIAHYFDTVVISEDVGVAKPDTRIFEMALERIGAKAHETVLIGDSFEKDVVGAIQAGIAAVWLNRHNKTQAPARLSGQKMPGKPVNAGVSPDYAVTIHALAPLEVAISAIRKAFINSNSGAEKNEQLETLAT